MTYPGKSGPKRGASMVNKSFKTALRPDNVPRRLVTVVTAPRRMFKPLLNKGPKLFNRVGKMLVSPLRIALPAPAALPDSAELAPDVTAKNNGMSIGSSNCNKMFNSSNTPDKSCKAPLTVPTALTTVFNKSEINVGNVLKRVGKKSSIPPRTLVETAVPGVSAKAVDNDWAADKLTATNTINGKTKILIFMFSTLTGNFLIKTTFDK